MTPLLVIEDRDIFNWLSDARFLNEFPFLKIYADVKNAKKCCGAQRRAVDFNAIKQSIANLPAERRGRLKEMLGAAQGRFHYLLDGKMIRYTF